MNYNEFINNIFSSFQTVAKYLFNYINNLFDNYYIKTTVFIIIINFAIYIIFTLISYLYSILNAKHDKKEISNIITSNNTLNNNESEKSKKKNKYGDNIKKKDIYW